MANTLLTTDRTPALNFADVSGALEYWAQVSADPRFVSLAYEETGLATSTVTPSSNLTDAKKYYWRFRARTSATLSSDQTNTPGGASGHALRDAAARTILAQTFVAGKGLPVKRVILSLKKTSAPTGNVWVEIWATSGGTPSAQVGTDSATVDVATLTTSFATYNFDFTIPVPLVAGTTYAITIHGDFAIDGVNYAQWEHDGAGNYASGSAFKQDGSSFTANGSNDHIFTTQTHDWGSWSPIWSFWVDSAFRSTVAPTTKFTLVDPDDPSDLYAFDVAPLDAIDDEHVLRGEDVNIKGDILAEYVSNRAYLELSFENAYVKWDQAAEITRFYHKRKAVFLLLLNDYVQDTRERVFKVEFAEPPRFAAVAPGRHDYYRGTVTLKEAALA